MNPIRRRRLLAGPTRALLLGGLLPIVFLLFAASSLLQGAAAQTPPADPPSRVARLSDVGGTVWIYHPDAGDWVAASLNLPLTTGDTLATEAGARAELQVGSATLRLDSGSQLEVTVLDDSRIALQLRAGAVAVRVRNPAETGPFEVGTEDGRFLVQAAGRYRFDRGTGSTFAAVDAGQVRYEYASSALTVTSGQRAEFWIDANGAAQYGLGAMAYDAFTAWNNERDRAADQGSVAARYVSPEMTGVEDLDRYGSWEPNADYGAVWIPATVAADWAPYSAGRWTWVSPWGWTWVDDAPWGFAPFHYGRWVNLRNRWCWTPGVREPRPVYAPALVGWVGAPRGGVAVAAGVGPAVGWFPLAPREVFVPGYRSSPRYIRELNTPYLRRGDNNSIDLAIRNPLAPRDFENRRVPRAVTVVPATAFADRRSLAPLAAQYRDAPWARDFARSNGPAPVLAAPPVAAPPAAPNRQADARPSRPPPGALEQRAAGPGRPAANRDGFQADTGGAGAQRPPAGGGDPRYGRPDRSAATPPLLGGNPAPPAQVGAERAPAAPAAPAEAGTARVRPLPVRPGFAPGERPNLPVTPGTPGATGTTGTPGGEVRQQAAPAPPPQLRPAAPPTEAQQADRVRAAPVNRGGERRENEGRPADVPRPPQAVPRSEGVPPPTPAPPPRLSPAAEPPATRPAESANPPRRVEGPRPAAPPPAEAQRPAVAPERRADPNPSR